MTFTIRTAQQVALEFIKDRAYRFMYLAQEKYGHGSPAHVVAWTVFADACAALAGETSPAAYVDAKDMYEALNVVERCCARRGCVTKALLELANRPHSMGSLVEVAA